MTFLINSAIIYIIVQLKWLHGNGSFQKNLEEFNYQAKEKVILYGFQAGRYLHFICMQKGVLVIHPNFATS